MTSGFRAVQAVRYAGDRSQGVQTWLEMRGVAKELARDPVTKGHTRYKVLRGFKCEISPL